ncbi:MAG: hypothetical protein ACYDHP_05530 [Ferrimicrobium sp.]
MRTPMQTAVIVICGGESRAQTEYQRTTPKLNAEGQQLYMTEAALFSDGRPMLIRVETTAPVDPALVGQPVRLVDGEIDIFPRKEGGLSAKFVATKIVAVQAAPKVA